MNFGDGFKTFGYTIVGVAVLGVAGAYVGARIAGPIGAPIGAILAPVAVGGALLCAEVVFEEYEEWQYRKEEQRRKEGKK
jgi:hypothetical protein